MKRINFSTGAKWEKAVGYSRAVKVGNIIEVSGTVAIDEKQNLIGEGDPYLQTKFILQKIEAVLKEAGAELHNIVRTRMYVTDINNWEEYGRAHGEVFKEIKPCTTMVEISKLISPGLLIEIEATAILSDIDL
jgi:enamine deaminase RidA (YjgF/YER057c/UK114 family)